LNKINSFLLQDVCWRDKAQWRLNSIPPQVKNWLLETGSLTLRMKRSFAAPFSVTVKSQGLATPFKHDSMVLQQGYKNYAFIREVTLNIAGQPFVVARTTIPKKSLVKLQKLTQLDNKPLGEVIFAKPGLRRLNLSIACIDKSKLSDSMVLLLGEEQVIWARRNTYEINNTVFLVSEFFLPQIF